MTEVVNSTEKPNGVHYPLIIDSDSSESKNIPIRDEQNITLYDVVRRLYNDIFSSNQTTSYEPNALIFRIRNSVSENLPLLPEASRNTGRDVLLWTRRGSAFRALLVVSVGTVALLALTGFLVFMLFFLVATINAIVISLLISLAAAGGFLAIFFACVTAIYIGALSVAAVVVSTATISAIIAALVVTAWIGLFYSIWLFTKKSVDLAKHSLSVTGSAISAYSSTRHTENRYTPVSTSD